MSSGTQGDISGKSKKSKKQARIARAEAYARKRYTKDELEKYLLGLTEELGRPPRRKELPPGFVGQVQREWGKWLYALEELGIVQPSEQTRMRRARRRESLRLRRERRRDSRKH